ncbi:MAG TPA: hypothetical protein VGN52_11465 [Burkholderiales bacterium]|jgi:hypothetical protein
MTNETAQAEFSQRDRHAFATRRDALLAAYLQTLLAINGGAIVAIGGMAQALVKQSAWLGYRPYAIWALAFFIFGIVCAALCYYLRLMQLVNNDSPAHEKIAERFGVAMVCCSAASFAAFLLGSIVSAAGIAHI